MFSQSYNVPGESLVGSGESNNYMDKVTETYGPKPSPKQVAEMAKYRGITYQRRGKQNQEKQFSQNDEFDKRPRELITPSSSRKS